MGRQEGGEDVSLPAWLFLNDQDEEKATGGWGPGARPSWKSSLPSCHLSKTLPGTSSTSSPKPWPWPSSSPVTVSLVLEYLPKPLSCFLSRAEHKQYLLLMALVDCFLMGGLNVSACWLQLGVGAEAGDIQVPTDNTAWWEAKAAHQPFTRARSPGMGNQWEAELHQFLALVGTSPGPLLEVPVLFPSQTCSSCVVCT